MSMEGPPEAPAQPQERESVTDERCLEAMRAGDFESVSEWYGQRQAEADENPSGIGRTMVQVRLGQLQAEAGFREEALETFRAAAWDLEGIYRAIPEGDERRDMAYSSWEKLQASIRELEGSQA